MASVSDKVCIHGDCALFIKENLHYLLEISISTNMKPERKRIVPFLHHLGISNFQILFNVRINHSSAEIASMKTA